MTGCTNVGLMFRNMEMLYLHGHTTVNYETNAIDAGDDVPGVPYDDVE